jgi:hypothetical protein
MIKFRYFFNAFLTQNTSSPFRTGSTSNQWNQGSQREVIPESIWSREPHRSFGSRQSLTRDALTFQTISPARISSTASGIHHENRLHPRQASSAAPNKLAALTSSE